MKIFYGPPGTGKTYHAAREAVAVIDGRAEMERLDREGELNRRYSALERAGRIWFVTFHSSYSYEDFVEGFRPESGQEKSIQYIVRDGPFKKACAVCRGSETRNLTLGEVISAGKGRWLVESVTQETVSVVPQTPGATGGRKILAWSVVDAIVNAIKDGRITYEDLNTPKGKNVAKQKRAAIAGKVNLNTWHLSDQGVLRALVRRQLAARSLSRVPWIAVGTRIGKYEVTHVDTGGVALKSTAHRSDRVVDDPEQYVSYWLLKRLRKHKVPPSEMSHPGKRNAEMNALGARIKISPQYIRVFGPVRALYTAWLKERRKRRLDSNGRPKVVMIIDELNRADVARVFGELLTIIEADKREGMPEHRSVYLPYSQLRFSVPKELSLVGTMNTLDRSTFDIDHALRRRFQFVEMAPDPDVLTRMLSQNGVAPDLAVLVAAAFDACQRAEYHLGHAYFKDVHTADDVKQLWDVVVRPLLVQHFWSEKSKVTAIQRAFEAAWSYVATDPSPSSPPTP